MKKKYITGLNADHLQNPINCSLFQKPTSLKTFMNPYLFEYHRPNLVTVTDKQNNQLTGMKTLIPWQSKYNTNVQYT